MREPRVRRFWCAHADRDVEVTFGRSGIESCSAFEAGDDIACARACVDPAYRRPSRPADVVVPGLGTERW